MSAALFIDVAMWLAFGLMLLVAGVVLLAFVFDALEWVERRRLPGRKWPWI